MIELTLKIDPKTFMVSMVKGATEIHGPLSKPTAEEIGRAITNYVEKTARVKWPGSQSD